MSGNRIASWLQMTKVRCILCNVNYYRLKKALESSPVRNGNFNCWGSTLYILNQYSSLQWIETLEMTDWLDSNTTWIDQSDIKRGDILSITLCGYLEHTAVYLGRGRYFHKVGSLWSEITTVDGITAIYDGRIEYRRVL